MLPIENDANGDGMLLNFTTLERVIRRAHDLPPGMQQALVGRLRQMQQLGFPQVNRQRRYDKKPTLGMEDCLKTMLCFEFLQAGMAPMRAVRLASSDWEEFRQAAVTARTEADAVPTLAVFEPRALAEFDRATVSAEQPLNEFAGAMSPDDLAAADRKARDSEHPIASRSLVVDMPRMLAAFVDAVVVEGIAPRRDVESALNAWSEEVTGGAATPGWNDFEPARETAGAG